MTRPGEHPHPADTGLPAPWRDLLAQVLPVQPMSAESRARVRDRLMQRITHESPTKPAVIHNIRKDEAWRPLGKRAQAKLLHDDGINISWLLQLMPGGRLIEHDHADGAEECMVVQGSVRINGEHFESGDYQIALPGSVHHEVTSETGALLFLKSPCSRRAQLFPT
jgi:anti-sigma factor ChrR (cupin superfamily)